MAKASINSSVRIQNARLVCLVYMAIFRVIVNCLQAGLKDQLQLSRFDSHKVAYSFSYVLNLCYA